MKNSEIQDRVPPQALDVERAVLGSLILEPDSFYQISGLLSASSFYSTENQTIYRTLASIVESGRPIDLIILTQELKKLDKLDEVGGPLYITQLTSNIASAGHIEHHARIIQQHYIAREIIRITWARNKEAFEKDIEDVLHGLQNDLIELMEAGSNQESNIKDAVAEIHKRIEINRTCKGLSGISTGLEKFDKYTGGMQQTDLIIIAAESSQGKTSLALTILKNALIYSGARAAIYSLEMSKSQLTSRIIASETGIPAKNILNKSLSNNEVQQVIESAERLQNLPLFFEERSTQNIDGICNSIRKLKLKHNINLAIVDYLQLVGSNLKNRNEESQLADITRKLKNIAKELNITVIALSQLSRDRSRPEPDKNRLRGSGQIEEAADIVLTIWRPETYGIKYFEEPFKNIGTAGLAEICLAKGRNVGTGKFLLRFIPETTSFYDFDLRRTASENYNPNQYTESQHT